MFKKRVCFIGNTPATCSFIRREILRFLDAYIEAETWCLQESAIPPDISGIEIFIVANRTAMSVARPYIPENKRVLLAARTVSIENLDKLIRLEPGSRAIIVGSSEETSTVFIQIIQSLGFRYFNLTPYYPGCPEPPYDIDIAITSGLANMVPSRIHNIIDLGGKGLDLSTFAELLEYLEVPRTVLNDISHNYIEAIINMTIRSERMAQNNAELKRNMEAIVNTVHEAILAVNEDNQIILFNPAAERLLEIGDAVGKKMNDILPSVDFTPCFVAGDSIINEIITINEISYIITANPIWDEKRTVSGVVANLRQISDVQELESKVRRALKYKGNVAKRTFKDVIGKSQELSAMINRAKKFARTDLTILLQGESGSGKELIAQAIHNHSQVGTGPFVALNFAALPENLVESELFGYEEGAFTGAKKGGKPGLFEIAHKGTIFLDEIGDAPIEVQKKLLRVLEEREVRRVGGNITTPVNVRVITATNQDLELLVETGKFRKDLFYRLCTLPILIPPLRARADDIEDLINYFVKKNYNSKLIIDDYLRDYLYRYNWPGNIRELENVVNFLFTTAGPHKVATVANLPDYLARKAVAIPSSPLADSETSLQETSHIRKIPNSYEILRSEFSAEGALEVIIIMLKEMYDAAVLNKKLGRTALLKKLQSYDQTVADHKIRRWLKVLGNMGFVEAGVTRQGSRLTIKGEDFLNYIQKIN